MVHVPASVFISFHYNLTKKTLRAHFQDATERQQTYQSEEDENKLVTEGARGQETMAFRFPSGAGPQSHVVCVTPSEVARVVGSNIQMS